MNLEMYNKPQQGCEGVGEQINKSHLTDNGECHLRLRWG